MTARALPTISPECLTVINDQVTTTSIDVARIFGKRHDHVLRTIESIEIPGEFTHPNFGVSDAHLKNKVSDDLPKNGEIKRLCRSNRVHPTVVASMAPRAIDDERP